MTDGAAAVLLASEEWAKARGLPVLAYLTYGKYAAVDFVNKEGLLMAPAYAVPRMLADARLQLQDFDFYEIHEAFEAQVLCTLKAWESPEFCRDRLGLARAARRDRSQQDECEGWQRRDRSSVRRDRRAHLATLAKLLATARQRTRADLDLHGRRDGGDCDPRALRLEGEGGRQHPAAQRTAALTLPTAVQAAARVGVPGQPAAVRSDAIPGRGQ